LDDMMALPAAASDDEEGDSSPLEALAHDPVDETAEAVAAVVADGDTDKEDDDDDSSAY